MAFPGGARGARTAAGAGGGTAEFGKPHGCRTPPAGTAAGTGCKPECTEQTRSRVRRHSRAAARTHRCTHRRAERCPAGAAHGAFVCAGSARRGNRRHKGAAALHPHGKARARADTEKAAASSAADPHQAAAEAARRAARRSGGRAGLHPAADLRRALHQGHPRRRQSGEVFRHRERKRHPKRVACGRRCTRTHHRRK